MSLFSGFKELLGQINKIDGSIYMKGRDFADVYAKNIALEEEIAARTKELEQANQTILTLNSVWDMMNSSQPLSSMLAKIVSILYEDMNYHFASILKIEVDENNNLYFSEKAASANKSMNRVIEFAQANMESYKLPYVVNSIVVKAITERKIYSTPDIKGMVRMFFPNLTEEQLTDLASKMNSKSCTIVPLHKEQENFSLRRKLYG